MRATEIAILGETLDRMEQTWLGRQETKEKRTSELVGTITPQAVASRLLRKPPPYSSDIGASPAMIFRGPSLCIKPRLSSGKDQLRGGVSGPCGSLCKTTGA